jgi:hypothetical protein
VVAPTEPWHGGIDAAGAGSAPAAGVALVVAAGIGATRTGARPAPVSLDSHHDAPGPAPACGQSS